MKKTFIVISVLVTVAFGYTIEYTMTAAQAQKLATATLYFDPIPQVNVGTELEPIWQDSCTAAEWTKKHYENVMRKTWQRYSERIKKDTVTADPW